MKQLVVGQNDAGQRLDKFLVKTLPQIPMSLLYKSIRKKRIKCNGKRCEIGQKLVAGDKIDLYISDDLLVREGPDFLSAPATIKIVYEDNNVLLADKPPGLLVHDDKQATGDTLIHRIQHYLYQKGEFFPDQENCFAPALCNRIDRNTCGIVIAAKNFETLQSMGEYIRNREITKNYLCVVHGLPDKKSGILKGYHIKDAATNTVRILDKPVDGAKTALTKYRVVDTHNGMSLLEIELLTGRTHQIRAQMAAAGHPLAGDTKYGRNYQNKGLPYPYQALCSYQLCFSFPSGDRHLGYLQGKKVQVADVPFLQSYGFNYTTLAKD